MRRGLVPWAASAREVECRIVPIRRILIVDDSATNRHGLSEMLTRHGYQCSLAGSGQEAIAKAKAEKPDMILMDVVMPGMDGYQATRIITRDEETKSIPVILCTSKNQETDRIWGVRQGAKDYVFKPVDEKDLLAKITSLR
jgi:twitching motility two-component system response regulator PilH